MSRLTYKTVVDAAAERVSRRVADLKRDAEFVREVRGRHGHTSQQYRSALAHHNANRRALIELVCASFPQLSNEETPW